MVFVDLLPPAIAILIHGIHDEIIDEIWEFIFFALFI
jgi:hypothetical protein